MGAKGKGINKMAFKMTQTTSLSQKKKKTAVFKPPQGSNWLYSLTWMPKDIFQTFLGNKIILLYATADHMLWKFHTHQLCSYLGHSFFLN